VDNLTQNPVAEKVMSAEGLTDQDMVVTMPSIIARSIRQCFLEMSKAFLTLDSFQSSSNRFAILTILLDAKVLVECSQTSKHEASGISPG
jgi:hypothetical protein